MIMKRQHELIRDLHNYAVWVSLMFSHMVYQCEQGYGKLRTYLALIYEVIV